ncbi:outer membrane lipoprotein carrier protein LolA [Gallaecimonas kandeliae]|uniref:outer membrane lipoprotein carrier protein LolA n=1 Tax=Gallaecimonas kandeliae TaxID=3029055 RepID=UPI00264721D7|nr:outer membrane lipoprotein carrier protein LolA [Gallaecimonas kandeliae]WKE63993.1 outer membrane lipoprotein carrier protein LolA [Gallaecimonas kandeliae]
MALLSTLALAASLAQPCGEFSQQKTLQGLSKPLESRGHYSAGPGGLDWVTDSPFPSTLSVRKDGLYQALPGQGESRLASMDNPLVASLGRLLAAVVSGDTSSLAQDFELSQDGEKLTLKPKDPTLAKAVTEMQVQGRPAREVRLIEPGGETLISLSPGQCR